MRIAIGNCCGIAAIVISVLTLAPAFAPAQYMGPAVASAPQMASAPVTDQLLDDAETRIAPGDVISIATYGAPELTTSSQISAVGIAVALGPRVVQGIKVNSAGEISLPYLGSVKLAGLAPVQAASYMRAELKNAGILVDALISVHIVDSPTRLITVIGEVEKPAPVPSLGRIRLLDAIAACGGFTPLASHRITIRRVGQPDPILIELGTDPAMPSSSDIALLAGDTVIVPKVGSVFVIGSVKTPAQIPLAGNAPITVLRALAMVGGVEYGAGLSKARIIRTGEDHLQVVIPLDLRKIMFGKQADVALLSDDILLVPANAFKTGMAGGGAGVAAALLYGVSDAVTVLK